MDELRRGDTARGIQSGTMRLRGGAYRNLRVTAKAAKFTARTSQRAMRTAGSAAMNRIKRALLAGDKEEIRKYMTEEEIRRWDSLTTFQKRKIIKEAGRQDPVYAKACILRDNEFTNADLSDKTTRNFTRLSVKDAVEEFMFLGLRMTEGVTDLAFRQNFGMELMNVYGEQVRDLAAKGLLTAHTEDGRIRIALTPRGTDISNAVLSEFLLDD